MIAVGLLNSLIRIFGDPYLQHKIKQIICKRQFTEDENNLGLQVEEEATENNSVNEDNTGAEGGGMGLARMQREVGFADRVSRAIKEADGREEDMLARIDRFKEL